MNKKTVSAALTEALTNSLGEKLEPNIWVKLKEIPGGNFYIVGHSLKAKLLKELSNA